MMRSKQQQIEELTLDIMDHKYNNSEEMISRAMDEADELYATFGIFVALVGRLTINPGPVAQCWDNDNMQNEFLLVGRHIKGMKKLRKLKPVVEYKYNKTMTTKGLSYQALNKKGAAFRVYKALLSVGKPLSRKGIERESGIPIETITGQIPHLINAGLVGVTGYEHDINSNRKVELLTVTYIDTLEEK